MTTEHKGQRPYQNSMFWHGAGKYKDSHNCAEYHGIFHPFSVSPCNSAQKSRCQKAQNNYRHCRAHNDHRHGKNTQKRKHPCSCAHHGTHYKTLCGILICFHFIFQKHFLTFNRFHTILPLLAILNPPCPGHFLLRPTLFPHWGYPVNAPFLPKRAETQIWHSISKNILSESSMEYIVVFSVPFVYFGGQSIPPSTFFS